MTTVYENTIWVDPVSGALPYGTPQAGSYVITIDPYEPDTARLNVTVLYNGGATEHVTQVTPEGGVVGPLNTTGPLMVILGQTHDEEISVTLRVERED